MLALYIELLRGQYQLQVEVPNETQDMHGND